MKRSYLVAFLATLPIQSYAYDPDIIYYHGDKNTRASDFAKNYFGTHQRFNRAQYLNFGNAGVNFSTELDCGNIDIKANIHGELNNISKQLKEIVPNKDNIGKYLSTATILTTCYAYPTICAQLRHDYLALKANLNLRAQACRAIDSFIDSQAEKGAMQLRAEAKANCINGEMQRGFDTAAAVQICQEKTGLPMRDFQAGLEKKFMYGKQKVLESIVKFAQKTSPQMYEFLSVFLGEIEIQSDGYWQPLFTKGMLNPNDIAKYFLAEGESRVCKELSDIVYKRKTFNSTQFEKSIVETIQNRITQEDILNIEDLGNGDRELACASLGRAIGQIASQKSSAEGEAVMASGLLNTAIPTALRDEYRMRTSTAFLALKKTIDSEQIPPIDEIRHTIAQLAYATRERNRILAGQISESKIQNSRHESIIKYDCTDTLSCGGG